MHAPPTAPPGPARARPVRSQVVREFGLTIDIDTLIREVDTDSSGFIEYDEFRRMMT